MVSDAAEADGRPAGVIPLDPSRAGHLARRLKRIKERHHAWLLRDAEERAEQRTSAEDEPEELATLQDQAADDMNLTDDW